MPYNLIAILGPTATGKTAFAAHLAYALQSQVISCDSRQVYSGMDIGTGKDLSDYVVHGVQIPYHLIDIVAAGYQYNLFEYQRDFFKVFHQLESESIIPILCGGTGLYMESVLKGYHLQEVPANQSLRDALAGKSLEELTQVLASYKSLHNQTDVDTTKRAIRAIEIADYQASHPIEETNNRPLEPLILGVDISREVRRQRITDRLKMRLEQGMIDEIKQLMQSGLRPEQLIYYGLEYKYVTQYIIGELSYEEMFAQLQIAIHQFAKRQMTWYRGMERRGFTIHWIDGTLPLEAKVEQARMLMKTSC